MSAHVLLNLLNKLRKRNKMQGLQRILSLLRTEFNKFSNTRAQMLDSIYYRTLKSLINCIFGMKTKILPSFAQCYNLHHCLTLLNL